MLTTDREEITKQGFCKILSGSLLLVLTQFQFQSHCHSSGWGGGGRLFEFDWEKEEVGVGTYSRLGANSNKYGKREAPPERVPSSGFRYMKGKDFKG